MSVGFERAWESKSGVAVIVAGSDSDDKSPREGEPSHVRRIATSLERFSVPYEVCVVSAHKQPGDMGELVHRLNGYDGPLTLIAVAGGTDALSGVLSYQVWRHPTLSCPPDGVANVSPLHNPPGSSNATVYRPENVARFVAQSYAAFNADCHAALVDDKTSKLRDLQTRGEQIKGDYRGRQKGLARPAGSDGSHE